MARQLWEVIGGAEKGGIMVREGRDLKSPEKPERLSTGALVQELELVGERLHFHRLTGTGPGSGWVSIAFRGGDLLRKRVTQAAAEGGGAKTEAPWSRAQAVRMMDELIAGYEGDAFQGRLRAAWASAGDDEFTQAKARQAICLEVQLPVIVRYGFEASQRGVTKSVAATTRLGPDPEITGRGRYLSWLVDPAQQLASQGVSTPQGHEQAPAASAAAVPGPSSAGVPTSPDTGETKVKAVSADGKYVFAYVGSLGHPHDLLALIPLGTGKASEDDARANRARHMLAGGTPERATSVAVQREVAIPVEGLEKGSYELAAFARGDHSRQLNLHLQKDNCVVMFGGRACQIIPQYTP